MLQEPCSSSGSSGRSRSASTTGRVALGGQKQRALLGLLLIHAGEVVSTERLVDELWGEQPPENGDDLAPELRLAAAQGAPRGRRSSRSRPATCSASAPGQLDLGRFERLVTEARAQPTRSSGRGCCARRSRSGEARRSPTSRSRRFAQDEIRRLEELRLEALEERIDADLELGGGGELVGELESLVAEHPLRERLRGQLMLALYRAGRQAEALQAYHDARRALVDELGHRAEPGAAAALPVDPATGGGARARVRRGTVAEDHFGDVVRALLAGRLVARRSARA